MPALGNTRHEKFAQGLAKGFTQIDAYVDAGYNPSAGNASVLAKKPHIRSRVLEIADEIDMNKGVTDPIPQIPTNPNGSLTPQAAAITEEWLVKQLMNNVQQAQVNGKFREANTAIEMLGNYFGGLFDKKNPVDQTQKNKTKSGDPTEGQPNLADMAARLAQSLSAPDKPEEEDGEED